MVGCYFAHSMPMSIASIEKLQFNRAAFLHRTMTCELNIKCGFLQGYLVGLLL